MKIFLNQFRQKKRHFEHQKLSIKQSKLLKYSAPLSG